MSKNLLIVVLFSVLIDVYRGECPVLMPCSQTHAAALSSLNSGSPNCSALQAFTQCVDSCLPSDRTVQGMSTRVHHVCSGQPSPRTPDRAHTLLHQPLARFANGTSLHLTPGDLRLLHDCSAFASCLPLNISPFSGADTCNVVGSIFKCIDATLLSCGVPKSIRTFFTSQKQKVEKLCKSDRIVAILPYFLTRLDEGDGLSAFSSPGCVELMRCTGEGQSLRPGPQDTDTGTFCINIKIVNKCIDESKDSCAVSSQFRSFIDHYRHEESEQCHSGVGVQSMTLTLVFLTAMVTMATRQLQ